MSDVAKYNTFKAISLLLTTGSPIAAVAMCSDLIVHDSKASISLVAVVAIAFSILFLKDKVMEHLKVPSPFIIALVLFILIVVAENILLPLKTACIVTMAACGIDELTFKRIYKQIETLMPEKTKAYKHFGFICCKEHTIDGLEEDKA